MQQEITAVEASRKLAEAALIIKTTGLAKDALALPKWKRGNAGLGAMDPTAYKFCVRGAICRVCEKDSIGSKVTNYLESFVYRILKIRGQKFWREYELVRWNNASDRKASEVVDVLNRASKLARRSK